MCKIVLYVIVFVIYSIYCFKNVGLCFLDRKHFYELNIQNNLCNKNNINILFEINQNISRDTAVSYQTCIHMKYSINDEIFLFLKNCLYKLDYNTQSFKNILFFGYGYNIFTGPIYFSYLKLAPSFYYIKKKHEKYYTRILIYSSGIYSYQLANKVYYSYYLTTLADSNHVIIKNENSLSFLLKNNTVLFKCSYNIIVNENKLYYIFPRINKYISLSVSYVL